MKQFPKVRFLTLILLLLSAVSLRAQELRFGINANPGMNWVAPDKTGIDSDGVRFAFQFGLIVDYIFGDNDRYAVNGGLNLNVTGAKLKGTDTTGLNSYITARINYLELPLTIKLRSNEMGYFTFYGQLGMVPSFAVRSRANYEYETDNGSGIETVSMENVKFSDIPFYPMTIEKVRPFNVGLYVEAGIEYAVSDATTLIGGPFFNTGFIDMFKDNDSERIVSRSFGFRLGVLF